MEDTIPKLLLKNKDLYHDGIALREKNFGIWENITWKQYYDHVWLCALGLKVLGLEKGDKVAILGDNCKEWLYADLAAQCSSATAVGIYPTDAASQVKYVLEDSESKFIVAKDQEQVDKILEVKNDLPLLKKIIVIDMKGLRNYKGPMIISFKEVEALGETLRKEQPHLFEEMINNTKPEDVGIIVYTSGTTGPPKGAMTTQRNVMAMLKGVYSLPEWRLGKNDCFVSSLPLCHMGERMFSLFFPMMGGCTVNFAETVTTLQQDLKEISPTIFLNVPRIWEKMYSNMMNKMEDAVFFKRWIFNALLPVGKKVFEFKFNKKSVPVYWRLLHVLAHFFLFRPLKNQFGFLEGRIFASGGAPLSPDLMKFYYSIGVPIIEGYGLTESTGMCFLSRQNEMKIGSVGKPLFGLELKLTDDGEILLRGDHIFKGYYRNPKGTEEVVKDGWLYTGDVGRIDEDGDLWITDRKKDIIITAGGKNITPSEIENKIKFSPYIKEAIVIGDKRKYLTCLIQIELENVSNWAQNSHIAYTNYRSLATNSDVYKLIQEEIEKVNRQLARVETVKKFTILDKELDQDDEELTATMKVKRNIIEKKYKQIVDAMY
jgi:long-chain acyl-CoA synthetase